MSYIHCEMGSMRMTSLSQAWRVRQASTLLQMPDLSDCCDEYIAKHLNKSFAIKIFRQARLFRAEAILEKARQILWKEFKFVLRSCPEIRTLSVDGLIDLIKLLEKKDPDLVLAGVLNWGEGRPSFGEEFSSQLFPHLMWHRMSRKSLSRVAELKILRPDLEHLAMKALISKTKIDLSLADWIECNVSLVLGCRHGSEACDCRSQGIQQMILQSTDSIESMTKKATGLKEATLYPDGFSRLMKKSAQTLRAFEVPPERIQVEILNDEGEDDGVSMEAVTNAKAIIFDIGTAVYIVLKFPPVRPIPGNREVTLSVGFERSLIRDFQERKLNRAKSVQKFENHKNVTDETLSVSFWETTINQTMVANENTTNGELKENVFVFSKIN